MYYTIPVQDLQDHLFLHSAAHPVPASLHVQDRHCVWSKFNMRTFQPKHYLDQFVTSSKERKVTKTLKELRNCPRVSELKKKYFLSGRKVR